jgi:branched-chain amino acid transport system substrate-binding protein
MRRKRKIKPGRDWPWLILDWVRALSPKRRLWLIACSFAALALIVLGVRSWMNTLKPPEPLIRVGAILPQTGPGAVFAQYIKEGIEMAVEEINAMGSPKIKVLYEDSKNQPREGVTVYNKLVSTENPPVVIVALSSVAKALAPLAAQSKTAQVYIAVALPDITDGKYTFRVYPEAVGMAGVMARFNAKRLNAKTAAVIYLNDDFGRVSLDAYTEQFEAQGGSVVFAESYELQQMDFRPQISKLKNVSPMPDVIYLSGYGPSYGAVIKQLKEQNVPVQLTADVTMGLPDTLEQVGAAADGVFFVDGKMSSDFIEKFNRKYGKEPSSYAGYAYDIVHLLHRTATERGTFTTQSVAEGLLSVKGYQGAMGEINIEPDGNSNLQFVVKRVTGQMMDIYQK